MKVKALAVALTATIALIFRIQCGAYFSNVRPMTKLSKRRGQIFIFENNVSQNIDGIGGALIGSNNADRGIHREPASINDGDHAASVKRTVN